MTCSPIDRGKRWVSHSSQHVGRSAAVSRRRRQRRGVSAKRVAESVHGPHVHRRARVVTECRANLGHEIREIGFFDNGIRPEALLQRQPWRALSDDPARASPAARTPSARGESRGRSCVSCLVSRSSVNGPKQIFTKGPLGSPRCHSSIRLALRASLKNLRNPWKSHETLDWLRDIFAHLSMPRATRRPLAAEPRPVSCGREHVKTSSLCERRCGSAIVADPAGCCVPPRVSCSPRVTAAQGLTGALIGTVNGCAGQRHSRRRRSRHLAGADWRSVDA